MIYGLKPRDIDNINKALTRFPEIKQALIFGSRAKNNHKKGSDVDLVIKGEKITYEDISRLSSILNEELPLPYFFDVIHYESINNTDLLKHIDIVGKEI